MLDELPLLSHLQTYQRPDIYQSDWNCILCHNDKETWHHLWLCPVLKPMLTALCQETKKGLEGWIRASNPNVPLNFPSTWDNLECWSYPDQDPTRFSFEIL